MSEKKDFQRFLERKFRIDKKRDEVLVKNIDGLELKFKKNASLERRAYCVFKNILKDTQDFNDINFDLSFLASSDTLDDLIDVIYSSCITLQNSELHEELDIKIPEKIVEALFEPMEIFHLGFEVIQFLISGLEENDKNEKKQRSSSKQMKS